MCSVYCLLLIQRDRWRQSCQLRMDPAKETGPLNNRCGSLAALANTSKFDS